jgi:23S rRNA pseudouridine2604 synthase
MTVESSEKSLRINKYLSHKGYCSRRAADDLIRAGRVKLNGEVAALGDMVGPDDRVEVDQQMVSPDNAPIYLKFHKPRGVTVTTDLRDPDNIVSFINYPRRIFPVGRLDKYSSGLILLTNDGEISDRILRPAHGHEKEYRVRLDRPFDNTFLEKMAGGVVFDGRAARPCKVKRLGKRAFDIVITEGRNRQIRRMCEELGYRVVGLVRTRIMHIKLDDLPSGRWCDLTPGELAELFRRIDLADVPGQAQGSAL